jgi:DNA (cytosine-5)-methyltransferase 1
MTEQTEGTSDVLLSHGLRELHLFAGAGGGILGGMLCGHTCVCAVEIEPYCRQVLLQRQRDGILPRFPIWDDVRTFDGRPWRGRVDIIAGGFPCQDISASGKGAGITGARSGLWSEFSRIIGEVRPAYVFVENSPMLVSRGLDTVLSDLASMGYDATWGVVGAHHAGQCHARDRCWLLAIDPNQNRRNEAQVRHEVTNPEESCRWQFARAVGTIIPESTHPRNNGNRHVLANWVTDLHPLEMDKFRQWLNSHGKYSTTG